MCRLFGFRSVFQSRVHRSLVEADSSLGVQSREHRDGWGVAYYVASAPHLTRSAATAGSDPLFHRLSGMVSSDTVVAHVRRATQGEPSLLNCHPFQYGRWVFAHNGDVPGFRALRPLLLAEIAERLRPFVLGETDSEVLFFLTLTELGVVRGDSAEVSALDAIGALRKVSARVRALCAASGGAAPTLTMLLTDGELLVAVQGGRELRYSTHKTRCADRASCPHLAPSCEHPTVSGQVNHFLVSSEVMLPENVWHELAPGEAVGVDRGMRFLRLPAPEVTSPRAVAQAGAAAC